MATLSLKITIAGTSVTKFMNFDPAMIVYDVCRLLREKVLEANEGNIGDYGLFLSDDDPRKGVWLESGRTLEYYLLRNGDLLEYKWKQEKLRVRMLDGTVKTMQVDDSHTVAQLMITICTKIGITNYEEYSLVREMADIEREKTLTIRRDRSIAKDQKKMDELKKKLHTDDELNWLDHSRTLREQGIIPEDTLLLRRKYFFSDQNIDARDPVQLNLLYVQTRDAILEGAHPISQEEAVQFASMQMQIQFGDHIEGKHKQGFLNLKEFLPKEYVKIRVIEKKILMEHKKLLGLSEVEAKIKYTHLARSLKTYGIAFFLVKEKLKGKNKLVPRLLGITKDNVVRVDEKTKEIIKTWPLTTVRRWAASPNSFTLDFGDYADSYYSVQTMEGERISQLIAGYIDIILKKKQAKDHLGIEGDEESTMYEDNVSPAKATIIQHQLSRVGYADLSNVSLPAMLQSSDAVDSRASNGYIQSAHRNGAVIQNGNYGMGHGQRALLGNINEGLSAVDKSRLDLENREQLPSLGNDAASKRWKETKKDVSRQKVGSQLSAMNAATAQMVTLTSGSVDDTDFTAVGSAVKTISSNIGEFSKDVRMLAALESEQSDGDRLLDAARKLAGAFSNLLATAQPDTNQPRQNFLNAATRVGEAGQDVMTCIEPVSPRDDTYKDTLLALAKAVANATATMVLKAKAVAGHCNNQADQNAIVATATQSALATSQLVACTKVVAPTVLQSRECQEQLVEAAKQVARSVDEVVSTSQDVCTDDVALHELGLSATAVTVALDNLMQHVRISTDYNKQSVEVDRILDATDRLYGSVGDTPEMVKQARLLALATSQLVNALKLEAESRHDSEEQRKLLSAAKLLADATARMVEAAKGCANKPQDEETQKSLKTAAEELRHVTHIVVETSSMKALTTDLQQAMRRATSAATQLINSAGGSNKYNRNQSSQQQLMTQCLHVADTTIPSAVQAMRISIHSEMSSANLGALLSAANDMLQPCGKLLSSAKAAIPTISDQSASLALSASASNLSAALVELRNFIQKCGHADKSSVDIDTALRQIHQLEAMLLEVQGDIGRGNLVSLPGESALTSSAQLASSSKVVGSTMAQLLTAASQGNVEFTEVSSNDTAEALSTFCSSIRGVAASYMTDRKLQETIVSHGLEVLDKSSLLLEEAKRAIQQPNHPDNQTRLAHVAKSVSHALNNCVACLPGLKEIDEAIKHVTTISMRLSHPQIPSKGLTFLEAQQNLSSKAVTLNNATTEVVSATTSTTSQHVADSTDRFSLAYEGLVDSGLEMAGATSSSETQTRIISELCGVSTQSSKFLVTAKTVLINPNASNTKNQLTQAARAVSESINNLIGVCTVAAPGQKECDNAIRQIQMMRPLLENPSEKIIDGNYFECLDGVIDKSKMLADSMTGISSRAEQKDLAGFCLSVAQLSESICGVSESAAHAAYLVATSDPHSEPGEAGLIDQGQLVRAQQAIITACQNLVDPANAQQQVLSAATTIAKYTSTLCNACRVASSRTPNPVAKRHFVQSAKDVANNTANLVRSIKMLDSNFTEENRLNCSEMAQPLLHSVDLLSTFAMSPEYAGIPAKISHNARLSQQPITSAGMQVIDASIEMLTSAKQLAVDGKHASTYHAYSHNSHILSEAMKRLIGAMRQAAPGQKECETSISQIETLVQRLGHATLASTNDQLHPLLLDHRSTVQAYEELLLNSARQLLQHINPIQNAAKSEPETLGHLVTSATTYLEPLISSTIGCASKMSETNRQLGMLDFSRSVIESFQNFLIAAKEAGGNPKVLEAHQLVDEGADGAREMLLELIDAVERMASSSGLLSILVDDVNSAIHNMNEGIEESNLKGYEDHQMDLIKSARLLSRSIQSILNVSESDKRNDELKNLTNEMAKKFCHLANDGKYMAFTCSDIQLSERLKSSLQSIGTGCIQVLQSSSRLLSNEAEALTHLQQYATKTLQQISALLSMLQSPALSAMACTRAANTVSGIVGDLDTTIMFATAGTLNAGDGDHFSDHRESILKTAKALVEDTKTLVAGAAANQEQLAGAAQNAVMTITKLADCVKHGAASLGSDKNQSQVLLINAVKDVATALGDLIKATRQVSRESPEHIDPSNLKQSAKTMVTNVTQLLKTVRTLEDEDDCLEITLEAIKNEIQACISTDCVDRNYTPDEVIRLTRPLTFATTKTVAAGNSGLQSEVAASASMGRKAVFNLLMACKGCACYVSDSVLKQRLCDAGHVAALAFKNLLEHVNMTLKQPTTYNKNLISPKAKKVADAILEIVDSANIIKEDETRRELRGAELAESELRDASDIIDEAARQLITKRNQLSPSVKGDDNVLENAKDIASTTSALLKAAYLAQQELVSQGKKKKVPTATLR